LENKEPWKIKSLGKASKIKSLRNKEPWKIKSLGK
jgi:hypothetical protein